LNKNPKTQNPKTLKLENSIEAGKWRIGKLPVSTLIPIFKNQDLDVWIFSNRISMNFNEFLSYFYFISMNLGEMAMKIV